MSILCFVVRVDPIFIIILLTLYIQGVSLRALFLKFDDCGVFEKCNYLHNKKKTEKDAIWGFWLLENGALLYQILYKSTFAQKKTKILKFDAKCKLTKRPTSIFPTPSILPSSSMKFGKLRGPTFFYWRLGRFLKSYLIISNSFGDIK